MLHHIVSYVAQSVNVPLPTPNGADTGTAQIKIIINVVLSIAGAAALLVITMAGFKFVSSRGDPAQVAQARNTILFSLIGLVVMMSAFIIVNFVVFKLR